MAFATTIKEFRDTSWRQYQNDIFIAKSWEKNHLAWGKYMGIPALCCWRHYRWQASTFPHFNERPVKKTM